MKHPVIPLLLLGSALAACSDTTAVRTPNVDAEALRAAANAGATLAIEDASSRVAPALGDPGVGASLTSSLDELAAAIRRGDAVTALRASRAARTTLDTYRARAASGDASDRDVIAMALDGADRLLLPGAAAQ